MTHFILLKRLSTLNDPDCKNLRNQKIAIQIGDYSYKDGDSGCLPIAASLIGLSKNTIIGEGCAMTGSVDINGNLVAIGGLGAKAGAAHRYGLGVMMPLKNKPDWLKLDEEVRIMKHKFISHISEVLNL
jgi:ATP-dependent Lon protease